MSIKFSDEKEYHNLILGIMSEKIQILFEDQDDFALLLSDLAIALKEQKKFEILNEGNSKYENFNINEVIIDDNSLNHITLDLKNIKNGANEIRTFDIRKVEANIGCAGKYYITVNDEGYRFSIL